MSDPTGFEYTVRETGDVPLSHIGRKAAVLRERRVEKFLVDVGRRDRRQLMARVTGSYKRGNER